MAKEGKNFKVRLFKISKELNVTVDTIVDHLKTRGYSKALEGSGLNASIINEDAYNELIGAFAADRATASRVKEKRTALRFEGADEEIVSVNEKAIPPAAEQPEVEPAISFEQPEPVEFPPVVETPIEVVPEITPVATEEKEETPVTQAAAIPEPVHLDEHVDHSGDGQVVETPSFVEDTSGTLVEADEPILEPRELAEPKPSRETELPVIETTPVEPEQIEVRSDVVTLDEEPVVVDETLEDAVAALEDEEGDVEIQTEVIEDEVITADRYKLAGTKIIGKIDLSTLDDSAAKKKKKRKRKRKGKAEGVEEPEVVAEEKPKTVRVVEADPAKKKRKRKRGPAVDEAEVEQAVHETLREMEHGASRTRQKRRRARRDERAAVREKERERELEQGHTLKVTEFISTGELANLLNVPVAEIIGTLFKSGLMVSINQRLDADTITFVADEYGFEIEFITDFGTDDIQTIDDHPEDLLDRAPVVTVMGHVDHGKTSLLDFIRNANVVAGEAGGITQHIGAYHLKLPDDREITFLDTPGHEAFTAMRARGAQVTDIVILVVAADDSVMPQTIEAINHARAADVPIVVAVNKIDKPGANIPRVMQQLADHNVLVEQYGGKVQCSLVSAKTGEGIDDLLEKVLLEADLKELTANPDRTATGVVIESRLEKGRGNVATVLIQNGTLKVGDSFVAGIHAGRVRAMFDERENRIDLVGPAKPASVLGFDGAPEVGDKFVVLADEREAREIAQRRQQIHREQALRQRKHITLDEIGRRLALGDFKELNLIIKADVGGSVEALADSLMKISTEEVAVNIIHSGVGAITESDVVLASASDAVIIGFQVRPIPGARALAQREEIDIRTYSIIYKAIEDVRDALEGMLTPEASERTIGVVEVRNTFKVPKIGTVAGCYVLEGRIHRNDRIRVIRDGVVYHTGSISSLKRFKDDVREVQSGYECGLSIDNLSDVQVGDQIEAFEIVETKRKLEVAK